MISPQIQAVTTAGAIAHLAVLMDAGQWAQASNLVSDARQAADHAAATADALAELWAERGPSGDARGWPVVLDAPNPVNAPRPVDIWEGLS